MSETNWYVVHTYSGYENKVKANIEKTVESRNMYDQIDQIVVPVQDALEVKNGRKKIVQRKVLPGYVLVKMIMNDDTWYVVRNTRGVTSFVGPGSKPVPLSEHEIEFMGIEGGRLAFDMAIGQPVKIISGPFEGAVGSVEEVNPAKKAVKIKLSVFGRDTFVELDYHLVQKM